VKPSFPAGSALQQANNIHPQVNKPSMSESPVEHFEHAEHAQHAAFLGDPFLTQVSITIAILAVVAATVGSLETLETAAAIGDKNAAALFENKATDT
jgi:hypothetical protein